MTCVLTASVPRWRLRSAAEKMKNDDCGRFGRSASCGVTHGPPPSPSLCLMKLPQ